MAEFDVKFIRQIYLTVTDKAKRLTDESGFIEGAEAYDFMNAGYDDDSALSGAAPTANADDVFIGDRGGQFRLIQAGGNTGIVRANPDDVFVRCRQLNASVRCAIDLYAIVRK